ncbi:MAG: hemerythrin domain-containing protein [Acidobacteriota bacterium]
MSDQFSQAFREEHRLVRDALLDLVEAFQKRDSQKAQAILGEAAKLAGPHFRYEEETLYPYLVEIFGRDYIEKLLDDHNRIIETISTLVELSHKQQLSDAEVLKATDLTRTILPHVSDCDGLSIMVERLSPEKVQSILQNRERALSENLDLFRWVNEVRKRPELAAA